MTRLNDLVGLILKVPGGEPEAARQWELLQLGPSVLGGDWEFLREVLGAVGGKNPRAEALSTELPGEPSGLSDGLCRAFPGRDAFSLRLAAVLRACFVAWKH